MRCKRKDPEEKLLRALVGASRWQINDNPRLVQACRARSRQMISNAQSAFIKRRCIQDSFMYVRNLARAYHRKKTPALLFKLDISKAFDMVSWEYMLELFGVPRFQCQMEGVAGYHIQILALNSSSKRH